MCNIRSTTDLSTRTQRAAAAFGFHVANLPRRGRNGFGDAGGGAADADSGGGSGGGRGGGSGGGSFKAVGGSGAELEGGRQRRTMLETVFDAPKP